MERVELAGLLNPRKFELFLLPTENCNFRCTYCYEDFEIGRMTEETIAAVKKLIVNKMPKLDSFHLAWFGGEPLIAKDIVLDISEFAKNEAEKLGVRFSSSMTTNAFALSADLFDGLWQRKVRSFQISLDGDEEEHNKTRKLISGKGTFPKIWENLLALRQKEGNFSIKLRVHVHENNIDSVKVLLNKINDAFGDDLRFNLMIKAVWNGGGDGVKSLSLIKKNSEVMDQLGAQMEATGWYAKRGVAPGKTKAEMSPCYAARPNSFVVRANGTIAKCTVAFNDPRNKVGVLNADGTLTVENELMQAFMRGFKTMDAAVLGCPMHKMPAKEEFKVITFQKMEKREVAEQAA